MKSGSDIPHLPKGQGWLINRMTALDYQSNEGGICSPIALLSILAWLAGDYESFYKRLQLISTMPSRTIKQKISELQKKSKETPFELSEEEKIKLEILAFFDAIETYYNGQSYGLFPANKYIDVIRKLSVFMPHSIKNQGGIYSTPTFSGIYTLEEIEYYLDSLLETIHLLELTSGHFALLLSNQDHDLDLHFDFNKKTWVLTGANYLDFLHPDNAHELTTTQKVAELISRSFSEIEKSGTTAFSTNIFCTRNNMKMAMSLLKKWKQHPCWQKIHEITADKAQLIDDNGRTWLYIAASNGDLKNVKALVKDSDVNFYTRQRITPLCIATDHKQTEIASVLMQHEEIDTNLANKDGDSPLIIAVCKHYHKIAEMLLKNSKTNINAKDKMNRSVLICAIANNNLKMVKTLLKHVEININDRNSKGMSALAYAVTNGNYEIIHSLLRKNADVDLFNNKFHLTPLFIAVMNKNPDISIIKLLLKYNADMAIPFLPSGKLLQAYAAKAEATEEMKKFIDQNNPEGTLENIPITPAEYATIMKHDEIADLINQFELEKSQFVYFNAIKGINKLLTLHKFSDEQTAALLHLKTMILDENNQDKVMGDIMEEWRFIKSKNSDQTYRDLFVPGWGVFLTIIPYRVNYYERVENIMNEFCYQKPMEKISQPARGFIPL